MLIATTTAGLARVAWVDSHNLNPAFLRFVADEAVQLGKAPTVQAAFGLALLAFARSQLRGLPNIGEVFQDDGAASMGMLNDAFGEDMIAIPVESLLPLAQLFQVPLCGLCSFGLQLASEAEVAPIHFFPMTASEKLFLGGDSRSVQAQIDADHFFDFGNWRLRHRDDDMQPERAPLLKQISHTDRSSCVLDAIGRDGKGYTLLACDGREADRVCGPIEGRGMRIIANRTGLTLRAVDRLEDWYRLASLLCFGHLFRIVLLMFLLPGESTLQGFGRLHPSLNEQVTHQSWTRGFGLIVGAVVQAYAVLFLPLPAIGADGIEGRGELLKCLLEGWGLFWCGMQLYSYGSVHTTHIPYMSSFCKQEREGGFLSSAFSGRVPPLDGYGSIEIKISKWQAISYVRFGKQATCALY